MRRALPLLALVAAFAAPGSAAVRSAPHEHQGLLFQIRFEPELNREVIYRVFRAGLDDPASLLVERGEGGLGNANRTDLSAAVCPALAPIVTALAALPLPAPALVDRRPYNMSDPRGAQYYFAGFLRFANGGEGEATFYGYDVPAREADPLLVWMRRLVRAVDACRPRTMPG